VSRLIHKAKKAFKSKFDSESKTLLRNSSWVFIASGYGALLAFLRSVIIARSLGAELLGTFTIAIAFVLITQELLRLNFSMGLIKYGAEFKTENRIDKLVALIKGCIYGSLASAALSIIVITGIVFFAYDRFIQTPGLNYFIIFYAMVNGFAFIDAISKSTLKLYFKFKINSIISMVMDTIEFIIVATTIILFPKNLGYFFTAVIVTKLINSLICNAAAFYELRKELGMYLSSRLELIKDHFRVIGNFVVGNSLSSTLKVFMNQGDVLLLGAISGPAQVGFYSVAKKLAYSLLTITDPLVTSIFPQLSVLIAKKQYAETKKMLYKITRITIIPSVIFLVLSYFLKDFIILKIYGKEFIYAAKPFFYLLTGAIQGSIFFWVLPLIQSLGLTTMRLRVYLIAILLGATASYLLVPHYHATGVAIGLLIANIYITTRFIYVANKKIIEQEQILAKAN